MVTRTVSFGQVWWLVVLFGEVWRVLVKTGSAGWRQAGKGLWCRLAAGRSDEGRWHSGARVMKVPGEGREAK